jgi:hypothetical protein
MTTRPSVWHRLDRLLARVRPHRRPLSLLIDGAVIALCWNATYLFRLGFERWLHARPGYDVWVMLAVVAVYLGVFVVAGIPRGTFVSCAISTSTAHSIPLARQASVSRLTSPKPEKRHMPRGMPATANTPK